MLDSIGIWPHIRARLRAGPLGPHLDDFVEWLQKEGYARLVIRHHIRAADVFGRWLKHRQLAASQVDEATVSRFIAGLGRYPTRLRPHGRLRAVAHGVRKLAEMLWQQGVVHCAEPSPLTAAEQWLRSFDAHLEHVSGVATGTRHTYLRFARALVETRFGSTTPEWSQLRADDITDFVRAQTARLKASSCRAPVTATRALLRYLATMGAVPAGITGAVPTVREWKLASLPRYLHADQVAQLLASCRESTWVGLRDRAILLLLACLGLRAGEVAALGLDDIDWRTGCLLIRAGKTRRERQLPVPDQVGQAVAAYLRGGHPQSPDRMLFVRARPPRGPLQAAAITAIAQRALRRAGIKTVRPGAHVLRHTLATQMVRSGVALKEVADVLGHAELETTAIYAKLDLGTLSRVALPWPGGVR